MHDAVTARNRGPGASARAPAEDPARPADGAAELAAVEGASRSGPLLACTSCRSPVTSRGEAVVVDGCHDHTFFNPAGVLFEIGCFARAPGCEVLGTPTAEFTWFPGTRWSYGTCRACGTHLGWHFEGRGGEGFYGLISSRLVEIDEPGRSP